MKFFASIVLSLALLASSLAWAQPPQSTADAESAAITWLALTDAGKGAASWDKAASAFQAAVTQSDWSAALRSVRAPLGALKSRTLKSASFTKSLPGAPDGEYVVIQYETRFENKASAIETVTPMKQKDGSWKVSGYFIR